MSNFPLERLGETVATQQDKLLAQAPELDTNALLAGVSRRRRRRTQRNAALATFAGVACVAAAVFLLPRTRGGPVPTEVAQIASTAVPAAEKGPSLAPTPSRIGELRASGAAVPVDFEDGSRVVLAPAAVADVRLLQRHGATVALVRGALNASVVHYADTKWDIVAGAFDIHVTGTRFDAAFEESTGRLTVTMQEGTVRVDGPCLHEALAAPAAKTFVCPTDGSPLPSVQVPGAPGSGGGTASGGAAQAPEAVRPVIVEPNAEAVLARADELRLSGDTAGAREAYLRVRDRFPKSASAIKASFLLGRMAEGAGDVDGALAAYAHVLADSPTGTYAQGALGRTLEIEQRRGNTSRAQTIARKYLESFPEGPHAAFATSVLGASP